jgi:hypothetical protein
MQNSVQSNSAAFRDTEFRIIPRNFRQFRMAYGIYGSNNVRNSVTEFRGHPNANTGREVHSKKAKYLATLGFKLNATNWREKRRKGANREIRLTSQNYSTVLLSEQRSTLNEII